MTAPTPALRVAIVGAGPRGLFALERLTSHARHHDAALVVDAYDPAPIHGAGPVYDPSQPPYLRMNLPAGQIDAWWPDDGAVPVALRTSLTTWLDTNSEPSPVPTDVESTGGPGTTDAAYVPRAVVGRYLHHALGLVERFVPPQVRLRVHRREVRSIVPVDGRWRIEVDGRWRTYDELLVTGGHRPAERRASADAGCHAAPLVPAVFPVDRWLAADRVPPGSTVALRGLALTAIDAILALTEGRSGRFVAATTPSGLRYVPGPAAPVTVFPYSRTGRPMRPKPDAAIFVPIADRLAARVATTTTRLPERPTDAEAVARLIQVVASVAADVLDVAGSPDDHGRLARSTAALTAGRPVPVDRSPRDELAHGHAVAVGAVPLDADAALGIAWRLVYPTIVARFGGAPLGAGGWRAFRTLAAEMERIGFGPSPENVAKLLALVDDGCVVLDHAVAGRLVDRAGTTELRSAAGAVTVDRVIDAVLPGPGIDRTGDAPLDRLLAAGHVSVAAGQRGLHVDPVDATALDHDGHRIAGLAAIGRHTEDATIGNDTLNRTLHPQVDRWAARVAARAARGGDAPPYDHTVGPLSATRAQRPPSGVGVLDRPTRAGRAAQPSPGAPGRSPATLAPAIREDPEP